MLLVGLYCLESASVFLWEAWGSHIISETWHLESTAAGAPVLSYSHKKYLLLWFRLHIPSSFQTSANINKSFSNNWAICTNIYPNSLYEDSLTRQRPDWKRERTVVIILRHNWLGNNIKTLVLLRTSSHFYNVPLPVNWASAWKIQEVRVKCFCCSHQVTQRTVHQVLMTCASGCFFLCLQVCLF